MPIFLVQLVEEAALISYPNWDMGKRILALDLGERRIGLAISDPQGVLAGGRSTYLRKDLERDLCYLERLIEEEGIGEIVLGLPRNMDGSWGERAEGSMNFKRLLEERIAVPVRLFDERLTSAEAERVLVEADLSRKKRKGVRDKLAAVLILQGYLDSQRVKE